MRRTFVVVNLVASVLLVSSQSALAQFGNCATLPDTTTLETLIQGTFAAGDSLTDPPDVVVRDFNYVCLVSGAFRDTFRKLSVVVSYDCSGRTLCTSASPVSQFDFTCSAEDVWEDDVLGTSEFSRRDIADASMTTPNRTNCSICAAPFHPQIASISLPYDMITHCFGKPV